MFILTCRDNRSDVTNFELLKGTFNEIVKDFGGIHGLYDPPRNIAQRSTLMLNYPELRQLVYAWTSPSSIVHQNQSLAHST
jgi:hypothetical protein